MRNIFNELAYIHDSLRGHGPKAALGAIVVVALGLIFGRLEMVLAGSVVIFVVLVDFVIMLFQRNRNSS